MLFNSLEFILFFLVVYAGYLLLPHRGQNMLLLGASYFFYGCWDYRFLALIALSTTVDYFIALRLFNTQNPKQRKVLLGISMATALGILGFFKYFNFFVDSAGALLVAIGFDPVRVRLDILLPVGISFYTFQSMSYTIDVYRSDLKPTTHFLDYALYVSLFTQLVAGPIERATHLLPQVLQPRTVTWPGVRIGVWLFIWGLFKKMVIADNAAVIVDQVFSNTVEWSSGSVLIGVYAFALQIYGDFSGYSDMARGLGHMLGFRIMVNFNNPYFALNPSDFWRRWHISLSTWLRDYLYIPLGGNRKGPRRTYINLMLTMVLGGLWHGAAWTFVFWGIFHGGLLAVHRWWSQRHGISSVSVWGKAWRMVAMFHAVCFGWLLFRADSMRTVGGMFYALFTNPVIPAGVWLWMLQLSTLIFPLLLVQILQERTSDSLAPIRLSLLPRTVLLTLICFMLVVFAQTGSRAFIYFQF